MKLQKSIKVNSVMFMDNKHKDILVFSANLNLSFGDYLNKCKKPVYSQNGSLQYVPNTINQMLNFNYSFVKSVRQGVYTLNLYEYKDDRYTSSFIEIV